MDQKVVYAGFWLRVAASIIDTIVFVVILIPLYFIGFILLTNSDPSWIGDFSSEPELYMIEFMVIYVISIAIGVVTQFIYKTWMECSKKQATLGKMIVGIKVTTLDGQRISFTTSALRFIVYLITGMLANGVLFIIGAFTDRKQCLHDMAVKTIVVKK
jgi:uncharacterized RDD family membrane protein YckC